MFLICVLENKLIFLSKIKIMARHRIEHIYRRSELLKSGVEYIGGTNTDGRRWKISIERAIAGINEGKWSFYIQQGSTQFDVVPIVRDGNAKLGIIVKDVDLIELQ